MGGRSECLGLPTSTRSVTVCEKECVQQKAGLLTESERCIQQSKAKLNNNIKADVFYVIMRLWWGKSRLWQAATL